jgi:hypothetical protein
MHRNSGYLLRENGLVRGQRKVNIAHKINPVTYWTN